MADNKKGATIFDFINGVTHKKKEWSEWSETDQKKFSPFIVNRWLSMRMELTEFVNELQHYTIGLLRPSETYRLYHDFLPASKGFAKYPLFLCSIKSEFPPISKPITGVAQARLSIIAFDKFSCSEGTIITSTALYNVTRLISSERRPT